jgi:hypothetical protein
MGLQICINNFTLNKNCLKKKNFNKIWDKITANQGKSFYKKENYLPDT